MTAFLARARRHVGFQFGAVLLLLFVGTALISLFWTPFPVDELRMRYKLLPSSSQNLLGTDHLGRDVLSRIMVGAQPSSAVGLIAVAIGMSLGVALGAWAAARGGWVDEALSRTSDLIFAFPAVLIAILITSVLGASARNAILAIAIFNIPVFARVTRSAMLDTLREDYVRTARAKGAPEHVVLFRHALRNAMIPVTTVAGLIAGFLVAGAVIIESVFRLPGVGQLVYDSINNRDLIVIKNVVILFTILVLVVNLLVDIAYVLLDPRPRVLA